VQDRVDKWLARIRDSSLAYILAVDAFSEYSVAELVGDARPLRAGTLPGARLCLRASQRSHIDAGCGGGWVAGLIHLESGRDARLDADWLGRKVLFFPTHGGRDWFALAGVDVEAPAGSSVLRVAVRSDKGSIDFSRTVEIHPAHYRTGSLTVPPKFVEPDAEALKRIEAESKLKAKVFAVSAPEPCGRAIFARP